jgi:O-antigen ligase
MISGLFLGFCIINRGPLQTLGILAGLTIIVITFKYPEVVMLIIIGYASRLIPTQFNYSLQVAGRGFFLTDFLLFSLLGVLFLKLLADRNYRLVKTPLDTPLLILAAAVVLGAATAMYIHGVNFSYTTPEARILLYYLIFFPVTNLIRSEGQLKRLVQGVFFIGILIALMMVIQGLLGSSINLIDKSSLQGSGEVIRFYNPGTATVHLTLMVFLCSLAIRVDNHGHFLKLSIITVLGIALLLTLARNLLISTAISLGVLAILLSKRQLPRLVVNGVLMTAIAIGILATIQILWPGPNILRYFSLYISRFTHLFSTPVYSPQETLAWRWNEFLYAWPKLLKNPILGIGLYTQYRPPFYVGDQLLGYIHNAYLWLWLKTGLLGLLAFLWLSFRFLSRGFRYWRSTPDSSLRATVLGFTLMYLAMIISNLVAPILVQSLNSALFGVTLGINEVIYSFQTSSKTSMKGVFRNE